MFEPYFMYTFLFLARTKCTEMPLPLCLTSDGAANSLAHLFAHEKHLKLALL